MDKPFEERKKDFLDRYKALTEELKCDVASGPQFFPIGGGAFAVMMTKDVVDLKDAPQPSPFSV
ncbi:MAG: hypothetical protein KGJ90_02215 [Patescibacteria group bacterium]|nr:hypothetical protein [Patescibacteria group bacterium]